MPIVLVVLIGAVPARAGVYFLQGPSVWPLAESHERFQLQQLRLQEPAFQAQGGQLDQWINDLEARRADGLFTERDRINLSAYYLYRGKRGDANLALALLLGEKDSTHFMILSNLATALHQNGHLLRAKDTLEAALSQWPSEWAGWSAERLAFYRRAEEHYLNFLTSRLLTEERGMTRIHEDIFPRVSFTDARGESLLGNLSLRSRRALPSDAMRIMRQLSLWMPREPRLIWIYAELLCLEGQVADAYKLIDSKGWSGVGPPHEYRRALLIAKDIAEELDKQDRKQQLLLLSASISPSGMGTVDHLARAGVAAHLEEARDNPLGTLPDLVSGPDPEEAEQPRSEEADAWAGWAAKLKLLGLGFAAGIVVGFLVLYQVREIRRRRGNAAGRERTPQ